MKALDGLRVLEIGDGLAGAYCTMHLADMGADVVVVEPPDRDEARRRPLLPLDRNKRSLALDVSRPEAAGVVSRLAAWAEVVAADAVGRGAAARGTPTTNVAPESFRRANPRLVYAAISTFGATGPYAGREGGDLLAQAMSGVMSVTGEAGGPPARAGVPIGDLAAGLFAAYGVLAALEQRDRTGKGALVDTSRLEGAMGLALWESAEYWIFGRTPAALGSAHRLSAPYQAIRCEDGFITVGANNDKLFEGFCRGIERPDMLGDPRFARAADRLANRAALVAEIERTTTTAPRVHWLARLEREGVPSGSINTIAEALADPHAQARRMVVDLPDPGAGQGKALGVPVKLSDTPGAVERPAPHLGAHTDAVLEEIGVGARERESLVASGAAGRSAAGGGR